MCCSVNIVGNKIIARFAFCGPVAHRAVLSKTHLSLTPAVIEAHDEYRPQTEDPFRSSICSMASGPRLSDAELAGINAAAVTREYRVQPHLGEEKALTAVFYTLIPSRMRLRLLPPCRLSNSLGN